MNADNLNGFIVGNWHFEVAEPSPAWVTIIYEGQEIRLINHRDLRDLEYAVQKAMRLAKEKLGTHGHEV